jgi:predicted dehydrogenase
LTFLLVSSFSIIHRGDPTMLPSPSFDLNNTTRRDFLKASSGAMVGGSLALSLGAARFAHGQGTDETLTIALVGCGGRGGGATEQALSTAGPTRLIAVADAFADLATAKLEQLRSHRDPAVRAKIDVPPERVFVGFDAYKQALDTNPDVVILATPPGFRPIHFEAAVAAGKHVFTEKPVATDAVGVRRFLAAVEEAKAKDLKVGVGLQRRHQAGYLETIKRLRDGAIGDIVAARVYWNGARPWNRRRPAEVSEMEYQMRNWYYFVWLGGDHIVEQHIHNLDVINWLKDAYPIKANGLGGLQTRQETAFGEIFDHHFVEYEYADGTKMFSQCRHMEGCWRSVAEHVHGSNGAAAINDYSISANGQAEWRLTGPDGGRYREATPYQVEHDDFFTAIRSGAPYNEGEYGAKSTMTAILGRMCTYSGQELTWDQALASNVSVMPDQFAFDAPPRTAPGEDGLYRIPMPGVTTVV